MDFDQFGEIFVGSAGQVRVVEFRRGPENFFDYDLIRALADVYRKLGDDPSCRSIVLASQGKAFCAGASYSAMQGPVNPDDLTRLYEAAGSLFRSPKPVVAAIQGAAIGGGLGMALSADFRVASPAARFSANFVKIGIHPGFGVSLTLPHVIGFQRAQLMIQTGRRIKAEDALTWGLIDEIAPESELREAAIALAAEIGESAPLAIQAARRTARAALADAISERVKHEAAEQMRLYATKDFAEGARAVQERRPGNFVGA